MSTREGAHHLQAQIVGNKAKGRISKRVFQENRARRICRKTNISYPLIRTGVRNVRFSENLACFVFFWNTHFAIRPFALLLTKYQPKRIKNTEGLKSKVYIVTKNSKVNLFMINGKKLMFSHLQLNMLLAEKNFGKQYLLTAITMMTS